MDNKRDLLIKPKFKKTPKNRKKDQFRDSGSILPLAAFPLTSPGIYGIAKTKEYSDRKKREGKASPEIKAESAKTGKMMKLSKGGGIAIRGTDFKGIK